MLQWKVTAQADISVEVEAPTQAEARIVARNLDLGAWDVDSIDQLGIEAELTDQVPPDVLDPHR